MPCLNAAVRSLRPNGWRMDSHSCPKTYSVGDDITWPRPSHGTAPHQAIVKEPNPKQEINTLFFNPTCYIAAMTYFCQLNCADNIVFATKIY